MGRPLKTNEARRKTIRSRLTQGHTVSAVTREIKLSRATVIGIREKLSSHEFP